MSDLPSDALRAIQTFTSELFVVSAPATSSLGRDAVTMLARMGVKAWIAQDAKFGLTHTAVLNEVQTEISGATPGMSIVLVDRQIDERNLLTVSLPSGSDELTDTEKNRETCFVAGIAGDASLRMLAQPIPEMPKDREALLKWFTYQGVGTCLMGQSGPAADAFASLMTVRGGGSLEVVNRMAQAAEAAELAAKPGSTIRYSSRVLGVVATLAPNLIAKSGYDRTTVREVVDAARMLGGRYGLSNEEKMDLDAFRQAFVSASKSRVHYLPIRDGLKPVSFRTWLRSHTDIEPLARVLAAIEGKRDPRLIARAPSVDTAGLLDALERLATKGDPTAEAMAKVMRSPLRSVPSEEPSLAAVADGAAPQVVVRFNAGQETIRFDRSQTSFVVRDQASGQVVGRGTIQVPDSTSVLKEDDRAAIREVPEQMPEAGLRL